MDNNSVLILDESNTDLQRIGDLCALFLPSAGKAQAGLEASRFAEFWFNPKCASYSAILLTKIFGIYTGEEEHTKLSDAIKKLATNQMTAIPEVTAFPAFHQELYQILQNLISTAYFSGSFYLFNATFHPLKSVLARFASYRQKTKVLGPNPDFLFITEIEKMLTDRSYMLTQDGLRFVIQQACSIDFNEDFDGNRVSARQMAPSLLHPWLKLKLYDPEKAKEIFEIIIDFLRHPSLSEEQALALLHMLRSFLLACPLPPHQLYPLMIQRVSTFYLWPRPFSDCARDVLELLSLEIKAPGAGLRSRFIEDIPQLHPGGEGTPNITGREKTVHLIIDKDYASGKLLHEILKNYAPLQIPVLDLQVRILYCIFVSCLNVRTDQLGLEYCKKEDIPNIYNAAMKVMEFAVTLEDKEAQQYRTRELTRIKEQLSKSLQSGQNFPQPRPPKIAPLDIHVKFATFKETSQQKDNSYNTKYSYPKRESFETINSVIQEYAQLANADRKPLIKIGIVGGDSTMHNLVCGFLCLRLARPDLFDKLDVRFFYIPVVHSELANYLGSRDKWFGRQVVCFSKCVTGIYPSIILPPIPLDGPIIPQQPMSNQVNLGMSTPTTGGAMDYRARTTSMLPTSSFTTMNGMPDMVADQEKVISPSTVLRMELEGYFREAKWPLNINIWRCECWTDPTQQPITIPFFANCKIGLSACIESFRKAVDLPATMTPEQVTQTKNFKFVSPSLAIRYLQSNVLGVGRAIGQQESRAYQSITLSSLPVAGDRANGVNANPSRPWLELLLTEDSSKKKSKSLPESKTYHVSQVELQAEKTTTFDLLLDGVLYGPFNKIKVSAAMHPDVDKIYTIPIMTFLPIDLNS